MKSRTTILALLMASIGLFGVGAASADAGTDLLKSSGCLGCHDMEKKKVGPAYKDVAAKYKGQKDAADKLTKVVMAGKPHPKVKASEADVKKSVEYILSK